MGFLISGLVNKRRYFEWVCLVIALCLGFFGVKGGLFFLRGGGQILQGPGGAMADNNTFATAMVMGIPFLYYLGYRYTGWVRKLFHYSIFLVILCVIATFSRGGFIALVALLIAMAVYTRWKFRYHAILLVLTSVLMWQFLPVEYKARMETIRKSFETTQTSERPQEDSADSGAITSAVGRFHFWKVAIRMANENSLYGIGLGAFKSRYDEYDFSNGYYGRGRAVHNTFLEILSENGWFAFLIFISMIAVGFLENRRIRRLARAVKSISWAEPYTYMFEMSLVAYLTGATLLSLALSDIFYHIFFLIIALRHTLQTELRGLRAANEIPSVPPIAGVPTRFKTAGS
jgi:probable O-glycosylation ligase (exosortase A-associated)